MTTARSTHAPAVPSTGTTAAPARPAGSAPVPGSDDAPVWAVLRPWVIGLASWGAVVAILSSTGVLAGLSIQSLPAFVAVGIVVPPVVAARSVRTRALVRRIDLRHLTLFNVWRVPAALAFFAAGATGLLPPRFVSNAAWGDLVAGVAAPIVVLLAGRLAARGRRRSVVRAYTAFHLFSFGDFLVAVGTGFAFSLLGDPRMRTLLETPMALIPLRGVPITGAVSLLAFTVWPRPEAERR